MITRVGFLALVMTLAACQHGADAPSASEAADGWYTGFLADELHAIPVVDQHRIAPAFRRQVVAYDGPARPGTIVVDIDDRHLYLVEPGGRAVRYGIGVGRDGLALWGTAEVGRKGVWPDWSPTGTMLRVRPDLPRYLSGGLDNPLGARALYLYRDGRDTRFRIHGTNEPWSIGEAVSSGCIRLLNEDVADLYGRVQVGAQVVIRRGEPGPRAEPDDAVL